MHVHTIQLNIEDFESGTAGMDAREKGAYISLLICLYKVSTHELPDDDKRLARMACLNIREWKKVRDILEPKFETYNGVWKHKRVLQEADRYQKLSQKNTYNALKKNKSSKPVASHSHSQNGANTSNKELITNNNITTDTSARVRIGKQIEKIVGWDKDPNWFGNYARIEVWLASGWDVELDILPTVKKLMQKKTGKPPTTISYFEGAIADAHTTRTKPLPKGNHNGKSKSVRDQATIFSICLPILTRALVSVVILLLVISSLLLVFAPFWLCEWLATGLDDLFFFNALYVFFCDSFWYLSASCKTRLCFQTPLYVSNLGSKISLTFFHSRIFKQAILASLLSSSGSSWVLTLYRQISSDIYAPFSLASIPAVPDSKSSIFSWIVCTCIDCFPDNPDIKEKCGATCQVRLFVRPLSKT